MSLLTCRCHDNPVAFRLPPFSSSSPNSFTITLTYTCLLFMRILFPVVADRRSPSPIVAVRCPWKAQFNRSSKLAVKAFRFVFVVVRQVSRLANVVDLRAIILFTSPKCNIQLYPSSTLYSHSSFAYPKPCQC